MQAWCIAHPWLTFLIVLACAPTITIAWHKTPRA